MLIRPKVLSTAVAVLIATAGMATSSARAGFEEGFAEVTVSLSGPSGPVPKGQVVTYTAMATNEGNEATFPEDSVGLFSYRVSGERPVPNPFRSVTQSGSGGCTIDRTPSSFGDYHSATCSIGDLQPGQSIEITATVEINESMDLKAEGAKVTTLVDTPPEYAGSKKIKIAGFPNGCVSNDFTLKVTAKGAEKVFAKIRGLFHADGSPEAGDRPKRYLNEREDASKLTARVDNLDARLEVGGPAYYELKVNAKYDGKPTQSVTVFFQHC